MQIVVNTRLLLKGKLEGIGWFTYQTLKRITHAHPHVHFVFIFDRDFDEEFIFSENVTPLIVAPQARHPFLYYLFFQHSVKAVLNKLKPALFLSPDGFLSLNANCKQLPVIHDINFLHHPADSKWLTSKYYNYYFPKFARAATRIATVSEYSKNDIANNYNVPRSIIDVVYNGINEEFKALSAEEIIATRRKYSRGQAYYLHVGALHPRKNVTQLIHAFNIYKAKTGSKKKLLLAGPAFWGMDTINAAVQSSAYREDIVFTGRLEAAELALVMGAAAAFCMVSYYEGFGIPLIEAMAAGVPIICSTASCLPEIAGDAALFADPNSAESIANQMLALEADSQLAAELIKKGNERRLKFSWDQSATLLWQSIEKAINTDAKAP